MVLCSGFPTADANYFRTCSEMFWVYIIYIYISVPINPLALSFPNSSEDESDSFLRPLGDGSTNAGNVFSNLATSWSFRCTTSSVRFGSQLGNIRLNQWHKVDQSRSMCFFVFMVCCTMEIEWNYEISIWHSINRKSVRAPCPRLSHLDGT